jgi:hypothetical protein
MTLQTALSKVKDRYRAYNMTSDGFSHYKHRLCKLCYLHFGDDEWQVELYCWLYKDSVSSMRVIGYSKKITNFM